MMLMENFIFEINFVAFWIKEVLIEVDIFEEKYYTHKIHNQWMIKALTKKCS